MNEKVINVSKARDMLYSLLESVNEESIPVKITNKRGENAVLVGEADWNAIQETMYINSVQGLARSIIESDNEDWEKNPVYNKDEEW